VSACHEGAIGLVDGKARLLREHYCDGLGDCLPACPAGAISFEEREAPAYDEAAVLAAKAGGEAAPAPVPAVQGGELRQWPVQIKLVPVSAPYFDGAELLIAADCAAYTYGNFHADFMRGKAVLIGCPKLDGVDYGEKLTAIIQANNITAVTVVRMVVPCCGGIEHATLTALKNSGKNIPHKVVTLSTGGQILAS
jgi:Fe-S-cluster-containing hydrogenase component 2